MSTFTNITQTTLVFMASIILIPLRTKLINSNKFSQLLNNQN